ncbi:hypothetical protein [Blastococcus sp. Marseille-P5729]|uniref:hypothetical protein n=1 Tax=Blastococcus sp. Marseille-P5729 TaxID=2086582 RepID=UPI000D0E7269|nr:hypothetical protein [Blastococcus sp. Marseille-P5729]
MNPSSLPPQGRYSDPRIQQMVLDELERKDIRPEKFYFTSDDWMVSYDGPVPAWNSVFGIAPYRKDGQTYYAECGVSQRYDAHSAQWGEPAATVKEGLPLSDADFEAAPSSLSAEGGAPDSSGTVLAPAMPGGVPEPGQAPARDAGPEADRAADSPESETSAEESAGQDGESGALAGFVGSGEAPDRADATPDQGGHSVDDARAADLATTPAAEPSPEPSLMPGQSPETGASVAGSTNVPDSGRHARPDEESAAHEPVMATPSAPQPAISEPAPPAEPGEPSEPDAVASSENGQRDLAHPGGGSAVYGGDAIHAADPEAGERGGQANVSGYALTVREDGTAELQVPLGGQVTLRWAGQ